MSRFGNRVSKWVSYCFFFGFGMKELPKCGCWRRLFTVSIVFHSQFVLQATGFQVQLAAISWPVLTGIVIVKYLWCKWCSQMLSWLRCLSIFIVVAYLSFLDFLRPAVTNSQAHCFVGELGFFFDLIEEMQLLRNCPLRGAIIISLSFAAIVAVDLSLMRFFALHSFFHCLCIGALSTLNIFHRKTFLLATISHGFLVIFHSFYHIPVIFYQLFQLFASIFLRYFNRILYKARSFFFNAIKQIKSKCFGEWWRFEWL